MMIFSVPDDFKQNHSLGALPEISEPHLPKASFRAHLRLFSDAFQGRSRSSISRLYNWRYEGLLDMPHVASSSAFQVANAGFAKVLVLLFLPLTDCALMLKFCRRLRSL
jgi:hypothetical protein